VNRRPESSARSTYDVALNLLGFRARSEAELRRKLIQKGEPAEQVEQVIDRLRDQKLIDDAEFARQFVRSKSLGTGSSRRRIVQELARKGVSRALADQAIGELGESEGLDPAAAALRAARKKAKSFAKLDDFTRRRRLYAFLARRGFDPDEIRAAMRALDEDVDV
jgi:regulatory protein